MSLPSTKSRVHVIGAARTHMDAMECSKFADSKEGAAPLVAPNLVKKHSKDPNKGLYPRHLQPQSAPACSNSGNNFPSFSKASELHNFKKPRYDDKSTELKQEETSYPSASFHMNYNSRQKSKRRNYEQQNKIHNYFLSASNDSKQVCQICTFNKNSNKMYECNTPSSAFSSREKSILDVTKVESSVPTVFSGDNCFGLFGTSGFEDEEESQGINYFELLPPAVLEQILCQIPYLDLLKLKLVCSYWNEVISNEKFMQWKKTYYKLKSGDPESQNMLQALCLSVDLNSVNECFLSLIRYMEAGYARKPPHNMLDTLKKHPKYVDVHSMLVERFPDWASKELNPWCVIAGIVILSETVWNVYSIFQHLLNSASQCSVCDILECMYCIATFMLYFKNVFKINHGLHYRIYYALYLFENNYSGRSDSLQAIQRNSSGQQSIHKYRLSTAVKFTHEQMRIVNHDLRKGQVVKIVAFAGTGKTSTLIEFTRLHPNLKFLNIMFNKAVCEHASKCFPSNVECRTAHSLANEKIGRQYRHKICSKVRAYDLIPYVQMPGYARTNIYSYARCVLKTLEAYIASADEIITTAHVPLYMRNSEDFIIGRQLDIDVKLAVVKTAEEIWNKMIDKEQPVPRITHDVYLKLHQLSHPKFKNYDCILVDEAQDCNGAMLDIILSQQVPIIVVGDPNQQIYGFRGATNALENVKSTHTYYLTQSFRFGPEIAYIASCCIEVLKNCNKETLVGSSKKASVFGKTSGQYAIIARTNSSLFNEAVRLCCLKSIRENEPTTIRGAFAGGISSYGFDQLLDIYNLMSLSETLSSGGNSKELNLQMKSKFCQRFKTFKDLHAYAKRADEKELLVKICIVLQYNTKIPEYVAMIKEKCSNSLVLANTVFSTAHKSKGLEFDTVCLTEDFSVGKIPFEDPQTNNPSMQEEFNILYVALTRAKKCLLLPDSLYFLLLTAQEKFEYPVSSSKLLQTSSLKCVICQESFIPQKSLVLVRKKLIMASGRCIDGGPLCMKCATKPVIRPEIHTYPVIMQLDAVEDVAHRSMKCIVGPLSSEAPLHDEEAILMELHDDDRIIILDLL